jgi:hypothetical protein
MLPSFLGHKISNHRNRISMSPRAFRKVRFEEGGRTDWGIEYWDCANAEMKDAWRKGTDYKTKLIVGVDNNISGPIGLGALTVSEHKNGFWQVPSFLERDMRYRRAVKHKAP